MEGKVMDTTSEINQKIFTFERHLNFSSALRRHRFARAWTLCMLALADFCGLMVSIGLALGLFKLLALGWDGLVYSSLGPLLLVVWGIYALAGLYRSRGTNQVEELRLLTVTTTMIFLSFFTFNAMMGEPFCPSEFLGLAGFLHLPLYL